MNIPDKAVEAGEWAVTNYVIAADEKEHWGALDVTQEELRRVYLEAAAPFIAAQAWDEGREALALDCTRPIGPNGMRPSTPNPYLDPQ